jgi:hypothetical protein
MDFLLESIGFPPGTDHGELIEVVLRRGEGVPWRGDPSNHMRLPLGEGLELRVDRDPERGFWTLLPHYQTPQRLRVLVERIRRVPDSPFDALLEGWAAPPTPEELADGLGTLPGAFRVAAWLTDAKRLPRTMKRGSVIAISVAGFALSLDRIGPLEQARDQSILELDRGCSIAPLEGADVPGGCIEISARVKEVRTLRNGLSGELVRMIVADAPERPLLLFLSRWQLEQDALPLPRPGWRLEGAFLLSGRIAGGLPRTQDRVGGAFG